MKMRVLSAVAIALIALLLLAACRQQPPEPAPDPGPGDAAPAATPAPVDIVVGDAAIEGAEGVDVAELGIMTFYESPWFEGRGYPPVEERLPRNPKVWAGVTEELMPFQRGEFGGTLRTIRMNATWDALMWTGGYQHLIVSPNREAEEFLPNLLESFTVNDDLTVFYFTLREGTRWSDGHPLTTEDAYFAFHYFIMDPRIHPTTSTWFRSGGMPRGNVAQFDVIDRYTWRLSFDAPFGGLILRMAFSNYTDHLQPAHYLRDFHIEHADEDTLRAKVEAQGFLFPEEWHTFFQYHRVNAWESGRTSQMYGNTPILGPWVHSVNGDLRIYHRNPYFWMVDRYGQQLPYIDYIHSHFVTDIAAASIRILAGDIDHAYEWVPLNQVPLFAEHAAAGGYRLLTNTLLHRSDGDLFINQTYDCEVWRSVARDVRFRQALSMAINREEILEAVYFGFARVGDIQAAVWDLDGANALLDEMGMEFGPDGFRRAPCGSPFIIDFIYSGGFAQFIPTAQIANESWRDLGLNINFRMGEQSLVDELAVANELQIGINFQHGNVAAPFDCWRFDYWGRLWNQYWQTAGGEGEPLPPHVLEFYEQVFGIRSIHPREIPAARANLRRMQAENYFSIIPVVDVVQVTLINNALRNVPESGLFMAGCFAMEAWWLDR